MHPYEVLRRPVITEKNTILMSQNKYTFEIARGANKHQVKGAVEKTFNVEVVKVTGSRLPGKMTRLGKGRGLTPWWKKAVVTLKEGDKIEIFEGV